MTMAETITKAVPARGCLHVSSPEARLSDRSLRIPFRTGRRLHPKRLKKRTSAAKAVVRRPFTARLNPCPSLRFADYL